MTLTFSDYIDKVRACWLGKNIGGTLGTPFEGWRGVYDVDYYTHDLSKGVLPNDDLDLQIIWLNAAERYGKTLNSEILGEYWISYIVADWAEYGAGKNNLKYGLLPPVSGWYKNPFKDSCGCFIRSEIWACLAPGRPDIAVKYAYEDAICDHADEGMYGEIFCAAFESAAFVESDIYKLTDIALSYIPKDCAMAKAIKTVFECYDNKLTWKEARKVILQRFPGSFGMGCGYRDDFEPEDDIPCGEAGFDAPSNVAIMMLGMVYGEGDFSKSICISTGCCEDGDCTAGTLGAILGIIGGTKVIDEKWLVPIGDEIKTVSIDVTKSTEMGARIPSTVTELSKRVINLMPTFMQSHISITEDGRIEFLPSENLYCKDCPNGKYTTINFADTINISPVSVKKSNCIYDITVVYSDGSLTIREGEPKKFDIIIDNKLRNQHWAEMTLHMPEEWTSNRGRTICQNVDQVHAVSAITKTSFTITPQTLTKGRYDILLEIKANGRLQKMYIPIVLLQDGE